VTFQKFYFVALVFLAALLGYLSYQVLEPFLLPIAWAIVFSVLFYPLYSFMLRYMKWKSLVSFITLCIVMIILIGPVSYLSFLFVRELGELSEYLKGGGIESIKNVYHHPFIKPLIDKISTLFNITEEEMRRSIIENIGRLRKDFVERLPRLATDVATGAFHFMLMALSLFFFLRDGSDFLKKAQSYLPFPEEQKVRLTKLVKDIIVSTMFGGVVIAIVQGTLGGIVFATLGLQSPVLWGFAMAIASLMPLVGPFVVWGPAALYLLIEGEVLKGMSLAVLGVFGISMIDNFLRPLIVGRRTKIPFLVLFFSVLGGIKLFGIIGFIMGPLILATFVLVVEIFRSIEVGSVNNTTQ